MDVVQQRPQIPVLLPAFLTSFEKTGFEGAMRAIVNEEVLPVIATVDHVIDSICSFDPEATRHGR